jgi:hypothetical protein
MGFRVVTFLVEFGTKLDLLTEATLLLVRPDFDGIAATLFGSALVRPRRVSSRGVAPEESKRLVRPIRSRLWWILPSRCALDTGSNSKVDEVSGCCCCFANSRRWYREPSTLVQRCLSRGPSFTERTPGLDTRPRSAFVHRCLSVVSCFVERTPGFMP